MLQAQMLWVAKCGKSVQEQQSAGLCIQGSMEAVLECRHEARPAKKLHHLPILRVDRSKFYCSRLLQSPSKPLGRRLQRFDTAPLSHHGNTGAISRQIPGHWQAAGSVDSGSGSGSSSRSCTHHPAA